MQSLDDSFTFCDVFKSTLGNVIMKHILEKCFIHEAFKG